MASGEDDIDAGLVSQFVAVTEASDDTARTFVSAADGDLQNAVAMYFAAGHGDAAPRATASQAVPRRQPELRENGVPLSAAVDPMPPAPPRRRAGNPLALAVRAIGVVFSTAFRAADWVIGLLLPGSVYRAWRGILSRLLGASAGNHQPVSAILTEAYGDNILQFRDGKWQHAYNRACQQGRPLLVYLHSDHNPATTEFCSEALCDENVVTFASANFVCWGAPSDSTDAAHLTRLLRVAAFPFMAILAPAEPSTSASMQAPARIRVLAALNGAPDAPMGPQLLALLQSGTEQAQHFQTETTRRQEAAATAAVEARSLREEQDAALAASMAEDRRRGEVAAAARRKAAEEKEAEEAEQRALQEEQERKLQMIEDRRNAIDERREQKRASLAPEPLVGEGCAPTTLIRVRLPHGGSSQRRFDEGAGVSAVYDWVDSLSDIDVWDYVITSTFPRREYSRTEGSMALRDAGLVPNAAIMVIAQDN